MSRDQQITRWGCRSCGRWVASSVNAAGELTWHCECYFVIPTAHGILTSKALADAQSLASDLQEDMA